MTKIKRRSYTASFLRMLLWSLVAYMLGGVTITGRVPWRPGILVLNHTSHVDTVVVFSVLHWRSRPFVVAAKDYWSNGLKRFIANGLVATVLVERGGASDAYENLRKTVEERLSKGELVILFPEGTRTTSGEIAEFKGGAVRLASDLQVPLYPAALKGMRRLFPKGGKLRPGRMEINFGEPVIAPPGLDKEGVKQFSKELREIILKLKDTDKPKFRLQSPPFG